MSAGRLVRLGTLAVRAPLVVLAGYLGALTAAAWVGELRHRRRERGPTAGPRDFLVLIPAHDEERLIGATLDSLLGQDHPAEHVEVHVVADNCTDATADVVRSRGIEVHERHAPDTPGKGPALEWLLERLEQRGPLTATLVFLDADTVADPGFLRAVDAAMADGAVATQAHYAVRDTGGSPAVAFRAAAFAARNYLRPLGRVTLGGTAGLSGNGMAFEPSVMRRRTWTDHLTEDAELCLELLRDGVKVGFAPGARVEAEMPDGLVASQSQHDRWEQGRIELARRFVPDLVRDVRRGGRPGRVAALDATLDTLVPPLSIVVTASAAWGGLAALRHMVRPTGASRRDLAVAVPVVAVEAGYVLSALRMVRAPAATYRALLGAPRMVAWKIAQWTRILVRPRDDGWVRTARNEP